MIRATGFTKTAGSLVITTASGPVVIQREDLGRLVTVLSEGLAISDLEPMRKTILRRIDRLREHGDRASHLCDKRWGRA